METSLNKYNLSKKIAIEELKIEVIIPTLNEESSIKEVIQQIKKLAIPSKISILVIDGGSKDDTIKICEQENVTVIRQKGKGKGSAMREAVNFSNADIIVFIDGDGTYSVSDLPKLLEPLLKDEADMIVGSRTLGKREKGSISNLNRLGNWLFNKTINFAFHSHVTDSLTGYRAMFRETFNDLVLFSNNFEIEVEMTVEALAKEYRILEVPIDYGKRKGTPTKLSSVNDGAKIARTLLFISMNVNPLKFFAIITVIFVVIGMFPASYVINEKIVTGEIESIPSVVLSALLFVTGAISLVIGLVSELVVRSRRRLEFLIKKRNGLSL